MSPLQLRLASGLALGATCACASSECPDGFVAYGGGCFFLSEEDGNFSHCQDRVCGTRGSSLAAVTDTQTDDFLSELARGGGEHAFIGLYARGDDPVGRWFWIDGSDRGFSAWAPGEPSNWCLDEDCVLISWGTSRGWSSVSCSARLRCLCQFGAVATHHFRADEALLGGAVGEPNYEQCFKRRSRCWWFGHGSRSFRAAFLSLGLPCAAAALLSLADALGAIPSKAVDVELWLKQGEVAEESSSYGQLLDPAEAAAGGDDVVQRWVVRGAWGAILYSVALFMLAFTTLLHINYGIVLGFGIDAAEAFVMCGCNLAVGLSAHAVHRHLSPLSRAVAASWVLVLAASKMLMALCALVLAGTYACIALGGTVRESQSFCLAWYAFCWALLLCLVFQCAAGVALSRIHARAVGCLGDRRVFSRVVGGSWALLTGGTFGVGLGMGLCSALVVFDDPGDALEPVQAVGLCYLVAACCQFLAGAAMLRANVQIRAHFAAAAKRAAGLRGRGAGARDVVRAAVELVEIQGGLRELPLSDSAAHYVLS